MLPTNCLCNSRFVSATPPTPPSRMREAVAVIVVPSLVPAVVW